MSEHSGEGENGPRQPMSDPDDSDSKQAFGLSLRERNSAGRTKGLDGLFKITKTLIQQFFVSGVRHVVGKLEEPMTVVENLRSQIDDRYEERLRKQEKHVLEMARLRIAAEMDALDLKKQKNLATAQEICKEQAEADMQRILSSLHAMGVDVDLLFSEWASKVHSKHDPVKISALELSAQTRQVLEQHGIVTLYQLAASSYEEVADWSGLGETGLNELRLVLAKHGFRFRE